MKTVIYWVPGTIATLTILFVLNIGGMYSKSFSGKWNEEIRHDIQKESQAHRDGMQRNLYQLMIQHGSADSVNKINIRMTVQHQYSQTDTTEYPNQLQIFLSQMGL